MSNYEPDNKAFGILKPINYYALMLCLYDADFKCQYPGCTKDSDLTLHHLVKRNVKELISLRRYLPIRHYWGNKIILCKDHHDLVDNCVPKEPNNPNIHRRDCLCKKKINQIKKKFAKVSNGRK